MNKRKYISVIMAIALFGSFMPACGSEPNDGTISDVEIEQPEEKETPASIFTKTDSPYDYEYTTFTIEKAHMQFDVPASWSVETANARHIVLQSPVDDKYLPDTTINILCNYGENVDENELSQYTLNNHAYNFSEYFKDELTGLITRTGGINRHLRKYEVEDNIYNGLSFVDQDHAEDAATLTVDDVVLVDNTNKYYSHECGMITTYVKWDHVPFCFNAIVKQAYMEEGRNMIEHIVSSITYSEGRSEGYKEVSYKTEFTTSVPKACEPVSGAENVFASSLFDNSPYAGLTIGVFTLDGFSSEDITVDNINDYYNQTVFETAFRRYSEIAQYGGQVSPSTDEDGPNFTGPLTVDCTNYSDPTEMAGSVFGAVAYYYCDYYVFEKSDNTFLVAVIYQDSQKEIARAAGKTAVRKLRA